MLAVAVQDPVLGSYSSADASSWLSIVATPPATSTLPSGSRVAVCIVRLPSIAPVAVQDAGTGATGLDDADVDACADEEGADEGLAEASTVTGSLMTPEPTSTAPPMASTSSRV